MTDVTTIVNGVDLDRLSGTIDAVSADPALAGGGVGHVDKLARSVVLFNLARPIVLTLPCSRKESDDDHINWRGHHAVPGAGRPAR